MHNVSVESELNFQEKILGETLSDKKALFVRWLKIWTLNQSVFKITHKKKGMIYVIQLSRNELCDAISYWNEDVEVVGSLYPDWVFSWVFSVILGTPSFKIGHGPFRFCRAGGVIIPVAIFNGVSYNSASCNTNYRWIHWLSGTLNAKSLTEACKFQIDDFFNFLYLNNVINTILCS